MPSSNVPDGNTVLRQHARGVAAVAALCAAAVLGGCASGSGGSEQHAGATDRGHRSSSGSSSAASAASASSGASGDRLTRHDHANDTYGSLPAYLPSNTVDNNAPLTGAPGNPAVTSEGDTVLAEVGAAHVAARVNGPVVPGEGLPDPPDATTCTWSVTVRAQGAPLALSATDFNALDHLGTVYRVSAVPGQARIPRTVRPGHPVSFELRAVMPTGEGVMRWSPDHRTILGEWDFTVEND